jgi:hypothetical protein
MKKKLEKYGIQHLPVKTDLKSIFQNRCHTFLYCNKQNHTTRTTHVKHLVYTLVP